MNMRLCSIAIALTAFILLPTPSRSTPSSEASIDALFEDLNDAFALRQKSDIIWDQLMSDGFKSNNKRELFEDVFDIDFDIESIAPLHKEVYSNVAIVVAMVKTRSHESGRSASARTFFMSRTGDDWRFDNFPIIGLSFAFGDPPRFVQEGVWR